MATASPSPATNAGAGNAAPAGVSAPSVGASVPGSTVNPQTVVPGTTIPVPTGTGVEQLTSVTPPFRSNAPAWYTPPDANGNQSVWSIMGCAVPQVGRYLQTNNVPLYDIVNTIGSELFDTIWGSEDRKFDSAPSRDVLYRIHQLLVIGRGRLAQKTVLPNATPLLPSKAKPAPRMFIVYPIPYYGPLGCVNEWLNDVCTYMQMACTEAMQHPDNERSFYITKDCHDTIYGYLKYILVDMAGKFFGIDQATASADDYVIPDAAWAAFNPASFTLPSEGTSSRPPMGWSPTDLDLEPIRGIPVEDVIPFLQPWPDSVLKYSSGGVWAAAPGAIAPRSTIPVPNPNVGTGTGTGSVSPAAANPLYKQSGPPTSAAVAATSASPVQTGTAA